jgi:hypothetical protein
MNQSPQRLELTASFGVAYITTEGCLRMNELSVNTSADGVLEADLAYLLRTPYFATEDCLA